MCEHSKMLKGHVKIEQQKMYYMIPILINDPNGELTVNFVKLSTSEDHETEYRDRWQYAKFCPICGEEL